MTVQVSKATGKLIIPQEQSLDTLFPGHQIIDWQGEQHAVIDHDLRNYVILRRMGYELPNPMMIYYDWANGPCLPFEVQKATCALITGNQRAYVLNDLGTGKTKAALWAWDYLNKTKYAGCLLVVAPLSTLSFVWMREIFETLPHRKAVLLHGTKKRRLDRLNDPTVDIFVINHDGIKTIMKELLTHDLIKQKRLDCLVIDELAAFRNTSDRQKAMCKIGDKMQWVWGMTGKPMPHEVTDVWAQAKVVNPASVPKHFGRAREILCWQPSPGVWKPKEHAVDIAYGMMKPAVRFSLSDVTELPEMVIPPPIQVPLSKKQRDVYDRVSKEYVAMVDGKQITAINAAAALGKLLQISGGFIYVEPFGSVSLEPTDRLDTVADLIEGTESKVIVFSMYKHTVAAIGAFLKERGITYDTVTGDTLAEERSQIFVRFQDNPYGPQVINAQPACMSHGVTLTAADTIIWYQPPMSLDIYDQANARIRRIGQKRKQQIIRLQSTPVERKIYGKLMAKSQDQDNLLELFSASTMELGNEGS